MQQSDVLNSSRLGYIVRTHLKTKQKKAGEMVQVKSICCFSGRPRFDSQCPHGGLTTNHPYPVPHNLLLPSDLSGRGTHVVFTYARRQTLNTRESYLLKG